jgi:hypothetical protein
VPVIQDETNYEFGLYELKQYAFATESLPNLKIERDIEVQTLYDNISPTMTGVNYDTGLWYSQTTRTDTYALKIIDVKEKYEALIEKLERKAQMFEMGMDSLTDRERDVIQAYYFKRKNDLGLSNAYFNEVLREAQNKLCIFLEQESRNQKFNNKKHYISELAQRISKWRDH